MNPERKHNIEINWTYPRQFDDVNTVNWEEKSEKEFYDHYYAYYISRIFNGKETPIYIGITEQDFKVRLKQHFKAEKEFFYKRGIKTYRIGRIKKSWWISQLNDKEKRDLLETIEAHIINELFEDYNLTNDKKIKSATFYFKLAVTHTGFRGKLDKSPYMIEKGKY